MRHSEFWRVMEQTFGEGYAHSLAQDQVLGGLDGRTALEALREGAAPRDVWNAVCDQAQVSDAVRWRYRDDARRP